MLRIRLFLLLSIVVILGCLVAAGPITAPFASLNEQSLDNAHRVTEKVLSGAQPEGDESFEALKRLGIKTIISVDGAAPDADRARKFGMRYVHLPIEYSGVTNEQGRSIAKALDELPGPIYIHCHHGKHRSAAAVAVACVMNGSLDPSQAEDVLKTFGTGDNYKGLWKSAREARRLSADEMKRLKVEYVEKAKIDDLAAAMVSIDHRFEHLKAAQKAGWKAPADHPDIDPAHEALLLQELMRESGRTGDAAHYSEDFHKLMRASEDAVKSLRDELARNPFNKKSADSAMTRATASCLDCHKAHRD